MITAIIQARVGSSRLPGKVILEIEGKPLIWHVVERVRRTKKVEQIILATTIKKEDKKIVEIAKDMKVQSFAGSEKDVLDRYYQAAKKYGAKIIVRVTGDCPLVDPEIIDKTIEYFLKNNFDYVSTAHALGKKISSTYPDGLDTEVFSLKSLEKAWKEAKLPSEREHVTPYIWKNSKIFKCKSLQNDKDLSNLRWTVDEEKDLDFVRAVYKRLYQRGKIFLTKDILNLLEKEPELMEINKSIIRDEGYFKSLEKEKK